MYSEAYIVDMATFRWDIDETRTTLLSSKL